jgi:hypothetical protein
MAAPGLKTISCWGLSKLPAQQIQFKEHGMKMNTRAVRLGLAALALGAIQHLCAQPNFTGTWKMVPERSNYSPLPAPDSMSRKITQQGKNLKIRTTQFGQGHEIVTDLAYTTDGAECKNVIRGQVFTGTARFDSDNLVVESRREVQGMRIAQRENWTVSEDGKTLTIINHVQTPDAAFDVTIVLEKQPGSQTGNSDR